MTTSGSAVPGSSLARNGNYVLLLSGQFISQMGDRLAMVAIPWLVYTLTGSALSTGIALALYTLPYVLFGAVAGALIDRFDKRRVMVAADVARAALVLLMPWVGEHTMLGVYGLTFLLATATVFFDPSMLSLLPDIVPRGRLLRANSLLSSSVTITEIAGYAAAGFIVYYVSTASAFRIDAATFGVSALTLVAMRYRAAARKAEPAADAGTAVSMTEGAAPTVAAAAGPTMVFEAPGMFPWIGAAGGFADRRSYDRRRAARRRFGRRRFSRRNTDRGGFDRRDSDRREADQRSSSLLAEIREGLGFLVGHAGLRDNTILTVAAALGVGAVYPLSFLLAVREFDGTRAFGFMEAAIGAGYLVGSLVMAVAAARVRKGWAITLGLTVMGAGYCLMPLITPFPAILAVFAVLGAANAAALISIDTYFQQTIPEDLRGRVWGTRFTLTQGSYAVGVLLGGGLAAAYAVRPLFAVFGAIIVVPAVIGLLSPRVRDV